MTGRIPMPIEIVNQLKSNPYVSIATEWSVSFTAEFKKMAYDAYHNGKSMRQIFTEAGFDVKVLGTKRIDNFRNNLREKAEKGFEDGRSSNCRKATQSTEAQMAKEIRELKHRNAYLEQENEFLKKIRSLEKDFDGKKGGTK